MFKKLRKAIENGIDKIKRFFTDTVTTEDEFIFDKQTGNAVLQDHANPEREYKTVLGSKVEPVTRWMRDVNTTSKNRLITKIESSLRISFVQSFLISSGILESFERAAKKYSEVLVKVSFETKEFYVDNHIYLVRLHPKQTPAAYLPQLSAIVLGEYKKYSVTPSGRATYNIENIELDFTYKGRQK